MTTREEVNSFARFALEQLDRGNTDCSMEELYAMWRRENRPSASRVEDVAAVREAIDDFRKGDRGRPARDLGRELREHLDRTSTRGGGRKEQEAALRPTLG